MFKQGDKVVLVKAGEIAGSEPSYLTKGKIYEVAKDQTEGTNVNVINDQGRSQGYFPERFVLHETAIDLNQPLETVGGEPFVLLSTEGRGPFNIIGYVGDRDYVMNFNDKGDPASNHPAFKLRNIPKKPLEKEVYFNVYTASDDGLACSPQYGSRKEADEGASTTRVGCVKVKLAEGQYDE